MLIRLISIALSLSFKTIFFLLIHLLAAIVTALELRNTCNWLNNLTILQETTDTKLTNLTEYLPMIANCFYDEECSW
jgi:hypothetical protein